MISGFGIWSIPVKYDKLVLLQIRTAVKGERGMDQKLLEQEINTYREKVRHCGSKEEVWQIKEDYEDALLLGISVVESNPVLSLEQKLEYTVYKDTKLSMMARMIEEFVRTPEYEALPEKTEGAEDTEAAGEEEEPVLTEEEERKLKEKKRARAMSSYAGVRKEISDQEPAPFDVKG